MAVEDQSFICLDRSEYEWGQRNLVKPWAMYGSATGEVHQPEVPYQLRRLATPEQKKTLGAYALETEVCIIDIEEVNSSGYYAVTFSPPEAEEAIDQAESEPDLEETVIVSEAGYIVKDIRAGLIINAGYFLDTYDEVGGDQTELPESRSKPSPIPLVL